MPASGKNHSLTPPPKPTPVVSGSKTPRPPDDDSLSHHLTSKTSLLGLKLYIVIAISLACLVVIFLSICICLRSKRKKSKRRRMNGSDRYRPKEIVAGINGSDRAEEFKIMNYEEEEEKISEVEQGRLGGGKIGSFGSNGSSLSGTTTTTSAAAAARAGEGMGWGRWYSLRELEMATGGFAEGNVIGEGGYGVVYRGVLGDGSVVAVKNLLNNKGQAEREFKVEVEAIGKVKHKNLVSLIGYCAEGERRCLVYEYVNNGNLEQWLHGDVGPVSPLTWDIRMRIAVGTAKGLAYLHEGLEPKVVHRDVKSSNILLDRKWNAMVSDFGLAKLLGPEKSYVSTRVMGTFGYVSPEYASTGMLNERSDVYSFGVLLMEIITGRIPVDYSRPPGEMNLVDWFKNMVASRRGEELVDPLIEVQPPPRALKRVLLVCLRCIDLDVKKRPKMGQVVHMLEENEFHFRAEPRSNRDTSPLNSPAASYDS
ncbi:probable receptor-like serine/threonine-protein kinase At4g34500 [Rhododendron vialii]|uniref:probable receptor-like serine/threonine-protein kinase At4g34500 n=1 Tax=Rhododendron vialii TaxID=182163 RepID=UPI00265F0852|nr:probable receptor-like serine/threonine-protein kinase At4g34500 [Rhododendron vialii]